MREDALDRVARILSGISGVVSAARLDDEVRRRVVELESLHERKLSLPVRNLGVSLMGDRDACFVVLKTGTFRPPKSPSVYLVEEGGDGEGDHVLVVAGKRYTVVGQEATGDSHHFSEQVILMDESFIIFPGRRTGRSVPCFFLLPPLPFPELDRVSDQLGLKGVMSISPSLVSDGFLRQSFGFSPSNSLATLLVGFDLA